MCSVIHISLCNAAFRRGILNKFLNVSKLSQQAICSRWLSDKKSDDNSDLNYKSKTTDATPLSTLEKYKIFKDEESPVILDVIEERFKVLQEEIEPVDEYEGLNLQRGKEGVFDIEDLVDLLRREKAKDIFVVKIPKETKYVDFLVILSGKSGRHMRALAEFVKKVYKKKRSSKDPIPRIEGENSQHWTAIDLGNIALHIFSEKTRPIYDLESLWSLGSEFDEISQQPEDPLVELLQKHSVYLGDLESANSKE